MRELYPEIEPFDEGFLKVSDLHTIHYEQCGNPDGKPAVFLHGGPGGGSEPHYRRFFDPQKYRLVLFDQRGCGKSTPHAELKENTTWDLVADTEKLRNKLGIEKWLVFGGSWGSTLSLAYSQTHPEACTGVILRGIFMLRQKELQWFYQEGTSFMYPDAFEPYAKVIPEAERGDMIGAYYKRLTSEDRTVRMEAAKAWSVWEGSTSRLIQDPKLMEKFEADKMAEAFARIECHYFVNKGFLESEDQLLKGIDKIRHLPGVIVQGRYDVVCPPVSAWELHKAWPEAQFVMVPDAGHSMMEAGIRSALIEATDKFAEL
jgi:proline iminopeptidase